MDSIVNIIGIAAIAWIAWFFFHRGEDQAANVKDSIEIVVSGGYQPSTIKAEINRPLKLSFLRKDESDCLADVIIPEFGINQFLPVGKSVVITITPTKAGTFEIHCGMNMFHGKIIVN